MRTSDVFDLLRDGRPRTRSELAAMTGLARSTVGTRIDALIQLGLVMPYGDGVSTGGRPPSLFVFNPGARVVAGVDVGATHATAVLADLGGTTLATRHGRMDIATGPGPVLDWVCGAVEELLRECGRPADEVAAIGVGLPGPVEHSTGRPINPPIMPGWNQYDVPAHVQRRFPVPVLVDNDVNIMALGERETALSGVDDLVFIKVATGIGAGIVSGGVLQRGAQGTAGDLGHVRVSDADGVMCRCGNEGCLEAVAAGPALVEALRRVGLAASDTQGVVELVQAGDQLAIQVVRQAGRRLGEVVATLVNLINPSVVVIGGRLSAAGEHLLAGIREVVYRRSLPLATKELQIVPTVAGDAAGVRGAVALATGHALSTEAIEHDSRLLSAPVAVS